MTRHRNTENCCFTSQGAGGCPRITCKKVWLFRMPSFVLKKGMKQQKNFKLGCDFSPIHSDLCFFSPIQNWWTGCRSPCHWADWAHWFPSTKTNCTGYFLLNFPVGWFGKLDAKALPVTWKNLKQTLFPIVGPFKVLRSNSDDTDSKIAGEIYVVLYNPTQWCGNSPLNHGV